MDTGEVVTERCRLAVEYDQYMVTPYEATNKYSSIVQLTTTDAPAADDLARR